jgi:ammonia channel protein AmtB
VFGIPAILGNIAGRYIFPFILLNKSLGYAAIHFLHYAVCFFPAGLFSSSPARAMQMKGVFYSNAIQLPYQLVGIVVAISWTSFWTLLLLKFIESSVGLFTSPKTQHKELDVCEIHKRNNETRLVKERLMETAKNGDLQQLQELRKKFAINFGLRDFYQKTAL